jgi:hypothetical protein
MKKDQLDQAPEMTEIRVGDQGNETIISMPKSALTDKVCGALSRFVFLVATGSSEGDRKQGIEDIKTILDIEDMMITVPDAEHPTTIRNFLGSMAVEASQKTLDGMHDYGLNLE